MPLYPPKQEVTVGSVDQGAAGTEPWPIAIHDGDGTSISSTLITGKQGLNVNVLGAVNPDIVYYQYGSAMIPFDTETTLVSFTVPVSQTLTPTGLEVWGDYYGEIFLRVDGEQYGGAALASTERTIQLNFGAYGLPITGGQAITISLKHQKAASIKFHAVLTGQLF